MGKGEIARYEQFLLFPQCFHKACFPGASKGATVWEWVKCKNGLLFHEHDKQRKNCLNKYLSARARRINVSTSITNHRFLFIFLIKPRPQAQSVEYRNVRLEIAGSILGSGNILSED